MTTAEEELVCSVLTCVSRAMGRKESCLARRLYDRQAPNTIVAYRGWAVSWRSQLQRNPSMTWVLCLQTDGFP